ncbi:MAG: response regulator transcription factor [Labilithrix sp.]|nr:response regulator transcription factor [Labilithrix sp.]
MKVLVVEDDNKLARFLEKAFSEEGYDVSTCRTGREAVTKVASVSYALVLLDWMLPELDGLEACRRIRASGNTVPIVMLSARADVGERVLALDAGADDYLTKPFHLEELLARARAALRRASTEARTLTIGALRIDLVEHVVRVAEAIIDLTPREFALLALLARSAGRVVSRRDILERVWRTSRDLGSNVLEVHVKNLREKLGAAAPTIETVRGAGYRLSTAGPST